MSAMVTGLPVVSVATLFVWQMRLPMDCDRCATARQMKFDQVEDSLARFVRQSFRPDQRRQKLPECATSRRNPNREKAVDRTPEKVAAEAACREPEASCDASGAQKDDGGVENARSEKKLVVDKGPCW